MIFSPLSGYPKRLLKVDVISTCFRTCVSEIWPEWWAGAGVWIGKVLVVGIPLIENEIKFKCLRSFNWDKTYPSIVQVPFIGITTFPFHVFYRYWSTKITRFPFHIFVRYWSYIQDTREFIRRLSRMFSARVFSKTSKLCNVQSLTFPNIILFEMVGANFLYLLKYFGGSRVKHNCFSGFMDASENTQVRRFQFSQSEIEKLLVRNEAE